MDRRSDNVVVAAHTADRVASRRWYPVAMKAENETSVRRHQFRVLSLDGRRPIDQFDGLYIATRIYVCAHIYGAFEHNAPATDGVFFLTLHA